MCHSCKFAPAVLKVRLSFIKFHTLEVSSHYVSSYSRSFPSQTKQQDEISALVRIAIDGHRQATNARQPMKYRWNFNQWVGIDLESPRISAETATSTSNDQYFN